MRVDLDAVQALIREALVIWDDHGQALTDETLPIFIVAHLAGNDYVIQPRLIDGGGADLGPSRNDAEEATA